MTLDNQPTTEERELISTYYERQGAIVALAARLEGMLTAASRRARWSNFAGKKEETRGFFTHLVNSINSDVGALFEGANELNDLSAKINESFQGRLLAATMGSSEESLPQ